MLAQTRETCWHLVSDGASFLQKLKKTIDIIMNRMEMFIMVRSSRKYIKNILLFENFPNTKDISMNRLLMLWIGKSVDKNFVLL